MIRGEDCVYVGDVSGYIDRFGYNDKGKGCKDNIVAICENNEIIGYVNYLTMDDDLYQKIVSPDIEEYLADPSSRDDGITGSQLRDWSKDKPNNLFILSIAVDKEHQDSEVIKILTNNFLDELREKEMFGYEISSITADTVSDHGEDAMKMFRCTTVKDMDGEDVILPAPESDESGHVVTVRICEGENMRKLLDDGFDLSRERTAKVASKPESDFDY